MVGVGVGEVGVGEREIVLPFLTTFPQTHQQKLLFHLQQLLVHEIGNLEIPSSEAVHFVGCGQQMVVIAQGIKLLSRPTGDVYTCGPEVSCHRSQGIMS